MLSEHRSPDSDDEPLLYRPGEHTVPCATCGTPVDPLRAAAVRHVRDRFRYFCSARCADGFVTDALQTPLPIARRRPAQLPPAAAGPTPAVETFSALGDVAADALSVLEAPRATRPAAFEDPDEDVPLRLPAPVEALTSADLPTLLLALAAALGAFALALTLAGDGVSVRVGRLVLVAAGAAVLVMRSTLVGALGANREVTASAPPLTLGLPAAVVLVPLLALVTRRELAVQEQAFGAAGAVLLLLAGAEWLVSRFERPIVLERAHVARELSAPAKRIVGEEVVPLAGVELRPGEEILLEAGDRVPADVVVSGGRAMVEPWLASTVHEPRAEGEPLVAGARVVSGSVRAIVAWTGYDRGHARLLLDDRRRADVLGALSLRARQLTERWAPLAAFAVAVLALLEGEGWLRAVTLALVVVATLTHAGAARLPGVLVAQQLVTALHRGIVFRSVAMFDVASRVTSFAFCARGTLLLGEPEVTNVEPLGKWDAREVLTLVAGAEAGASHPVAKAVQRAARARDVRPDAVRSPTVLAGLGVTAIASNGKPLVVGSRALMLKERISVAIAEGRIADLEAMGRTVLLVAVGGRLVGVVALQDGLRPGARAAVQHLLDVTVEPILLSGDARETCEALGRVLDIDHIRPDLLPAERGEEVRRLSDSGGVVAVVGRTPTDDDALLAADVAITLGSAGGGSSEWGVELASDDVRDAALAVRLARRARQDARRVLLFTSIAAGVGALLTLTRVVPPALVPIFALAALLAATFRLRRSPNDTAL